MAFLVDVASGREFRLEPGSVFVVGRSREADLPVRDEHCSRRHFQLVVSVDASCVLEPLSKTSTTYCEGLPIHASVYLDRSVAIRAGESHFRFVLDEEPLNPQPMAESLHECEKIDTPGTFGELAPAVIPTAVGMWSDATDDDAIKTIRLGMTATIGRDPKCSEIVLSHPLVSRRHARLVQHRGGTILTDLNSSGGTFVNGQRLDGSQRIDVHDVIGIGPYQLVFDAGLLREANRENNLQVTAQHLSKYVSDSATGMRTKAILRDITLVIDPREFVVLLGPAGCGKSTLLGALSARAKADEGYVALNDRDLYQNYEMLKSDLAYVPQRDLLHPALTVEESLSYTARLRLPADTDLGELERQVTLTLETVGLHEHRKTKIAHLSGGQTKRCSLATEIIANPSLIFLDEVTSGLDPQSDHEMMQLFRQLANRGKTLVCVTHHLTNVAKNAHLIVVLAAGGNLAFIGTPQEALSHFSVSELGEVYEKLKQREPEVWRKAFLESPGYVKYVTERLALRPDEASTQVQPRSVTPRRRMGEILRQGSILLSRALRIQSQELTAMAVMGGQCLLVAFLLILVYGDVGPAMTNLSGAMGGVLQKQAGQSATLLFIMAISCFWFGCNNASKEIVQEKQLFLKERHAGLSVCAYYLSKLIPLSCFSAMQALCLFLLVHGFTDLSSGRIEGGAIYALLATVGVTLGLAISSISRTETVATVMVPVVLIPQIILSGGLIPLSGVADALGQAVVSTYWGYGFACGTLADNLQVYLPVEATSGPATSGPVTCLVLMVQMIVNGALAVATLHRTSRVR